MTDRKERIDPRYDPRFQRGYVGGEAGVAHGAIPQPEADLAFVPPPTAPTAPAAPPAAQAVAALRDSGSQRLVAGDQAQAVSPASSPAEADGTATTSDHADAADGAWRADSDRVDANRVDADRVDADRVEATAAARTGSAAGTPAAVVPDHEGIDSWPANRWLWIALGVCLAFVVVGSAAVWSQVSDPRNYMGSVSVGIDESMRMMVNFLAPALVQAGVVGAVVVLVAWAIRGRRLGRAGRGDGR